MFIYINIYILFKNTVLCIELYLFIVKTVKNAIVQKKTHYYINILHLSVNSLFIYLFQFNIF